MDILTLLKPKTEKEIIFNLINAYGRDPYNLIDISIRKNILIGVKEAIKINKFVVNHQNSYFLKLAIMLNNYKIAEFLINKGAIVNIDVLETALFHRNDNIIKLVKNEIRSNK